ncbi:RelE family toxin-antitoxin system [Klebsiella pneumoniae]|nr:RelE family toxin-antitoxin system [Klebsiella pneumoniae]
MTDITELMQSKSLRKKLNRRLNDAYGFQRTSGGKHTTISLSIAECKSIIAAMDERLSLVEALASEKRICATWRKTADANSEKLEKAQAKADVYDMLRDDYGLREKGVGLSDFVDWQANRIAELEESHAQVIQSRDHYKRITDEGLRRLAESRSVKLPDDEDGQAYGFGKWANGKLPATAGAMTIAYCEDAWRAAFEVFSSTAGIKVEAE